MNSPVQGRAAADPNAFNLLALAERAAALAPHIALLIVSIIAAIFVSVPRLKAQERAISPASITMDDVKAGSLLLRSMEQGRYVEAPRLGTDIDLTVSGPTARARHAGVPQPDRRLGRGGVRLSAARGRRGRYAQDGDRRPHRGG